MKHLKFNSQQTFLEGSFKKEHLYTDVLRVFK
jgi:hypothetical protein